MSTDFEDVVTIGRLGIQTCSRGSGKPLLLINGLGANLTMWEPLQKHLGATRVVSFDLPGVGRSTTPLVPMSIRRLAEVAVGVLDELGLERVDVLGYSLGGMVAQELALVAPERVGRLVLAATFCGLGAVPGSLVARLVLSSSFRNRSRLFFERTHALTVGGRGLSAEEKRNLFERRSRHAPNPIGYIWQMFAAATWTTLGRLRKIASPTLVVCGDDDPLVPLANGVMLAHDIPNGRLYVSAGDGHLLLLEQRSSAPQAVADFLTAGELEDSAVWRGARHPSNAERHEALARAPFPLDPHALLGAALRKVVA